jgi:hypothetical protein
MPDIDGVQEESQEQFALTALGEACEVVAITGTMLCLSWLTVPPHPASQQAKLVAASSQWQSPGVGPFPLPEAVRNMHLALLSGHDHMLTLASHLRTPHLLGTSFFTVVRGALEAFARAHFLLAQADPKSVLTAFLASRHAVLVYQAKEPKDATGRSYSTEMSAKAKPLLEAVKAAADNWSIPPEEIRMQSISSSVETVLQAYAKATGDEIPLGLYGELSQPAHAHTVGYRFLVHQAGEPDENGYAPVTFGLPPDTANSVMFVLLGVQTLVMSRYSAFKNATESETRDWVVACAEAKAAQVELHGAWS